MLQTLGPELQSLLELLDSPDRQRQLGLAEVHVSLATLEEVFLTVVKQVSSMSSKAMQWHCNYGDTPLLVLLIRIPVPLSCMAASRMATTLETGPVTSSGLLVVVVVAQ